MGKLGMWLVVCVCVVVAASASMADDMFPPSWRQGDLLTGTVDPGALAVGWDAWGQPGAGPGFSLRTEAQVLTNPGGLPLAGTTPNQFVAHAGWDSQCAVLGSLGTRTGVLEVNYLGGPNSVTHVGFGLANYDNANPLKKMRIQITFADAGTGPVDFMVVSSNSDPGDPPWTFTTPVSAIVKDYHDHGDGWGTRLYELEFEPNPSYEGFGIYFGATPGVAFIDQVVIDTICLEGVPIPEPPGLGLIGLALLGLRRRRS